MTGRYSNEDLQRYFEAETIPEKDETKEIIAILKPDLDKLFQFVKQHDARLCQQVVQVGSYYQGLKGRRSDEFDYTLCIDISRDMVSLSTEDSAWGYPFVNPTLCYVHPGKLLYGFKGYDSEKDHLAHTKPQVWYTFVSFVMMMMMMITKIATLLIVQDRYRFGLRCIALYLSSGK